MTTHDNTQQRDAAHSPTPWRVGPTYMDEPGTLCVKAANGVEIYVFGSGAGQMCLNDAAYIVEAVNSHERLVAENARLSEDLADTNEYVTHLQDQLKHYRTMVDLVRRMIHPTETTLAFAIKEGEMVKRICRTKEAEREVDACVAALQALLKEARAAIGEEAGND